MLGAARLDTALLDNLRLAVGGIGLALEGRLPEVLGGNALLLKVLVGHFVVVVQHEAAHLGGVVEVVLRVHAHVGVPHHIDGHRRHNEPGGGLVQLLGRGKLQKLVVLVDHGHAEGRRHAVVDHLPGGCHLADDHAVQPVAVERRHPKRGWGVGPDDLVAVLDGHQPVYMLHEQRLGGERNGGQRSHHRSPLLLWGGHDGGLGVE